MIAPSSAFDSFAPAKVPPTAAHTSWAGALDASCPLADGEVVARVLSGERRLFEVLVRRYNRLVFRAARAIVRSADEAEDVMQHAYVRAFEHLGTFEGRATFSTWLTRIAIYEALQRARQRKKTTPFAPEGPESEPTTSGEPANPERAAANGELRCRLEAAVDELPENFRVVFVLRAVEQHSVAEVASCLGIPEDTVKTRFLRARQRLRSSLVTELELAGGDVYLFHLTRCNRVVAQVLSRIG